MPLLRFTCPYQALHAPTKQFKCPYQASNAPTKLQSEQSRAIQGQVHLNIRLYFSILPSAATATLLQDLYAPDDKNATGGLKVQL